MKNELNSKEWLVLAEYIRYGNAVFYSWEEDGELEINSKTLESAKEKFKEVAVSIKE